MAAEKKSTGTNILLYTLVVSIQNIKNSAETKEAEIKNHIRAPVNGNNKLGVKHSNL